MTRVTRFHRGRITNVTRSFFENPIQRGGLFIHSKENWRNDDRAFAYRIYFPSGNGTTVTGPRGNYALTKHRFEINAKATGQTGRRFEQSRGITTCVIFWTDKYFLIIRPRRPAAEPYNSTSIAHHGGQVSRTLQRCPKDTPCNNEIAIHEYRDLRKPAYYR